MKLGVAGNGMIVKTALNCLKQTDIEVSALWCRSEEKGKPLCEEFDLKQYTDYDTFLKDDSFDTVYIGLINSLHYEYTLKALQAKKHVIVEKPFTNTSKEAEELIACAKENNVYIFEAIMSRYSKNYEALKSELKRIGDLKVIRANYSQYSSRYNAYREGTVLPAFDPKLWGGALQDINVYNIHFVVGLFGMPEEVHYYANKGFNGIDTSGTLILGYGAFHAVCTGAKDSASVSGTVIQGTDGYIELPERPGFIKGVTYYENVKSEGEVLDVAIETSPMVVEFETIRDVIDEKETDIVNEWMKHTAEVMKVMEMAREDAGIILG